MNHNIKKVIIWGHKLHSHTHSYIHFGFFKAFKYLNYDTYWFDKNDDISNFDFTGSLFLTAGQVDDNIPLRTDCYYILHNVNQDKYKKLNNNNILIIQVFTKDCLKRNEKKIDNCMHYTKTTNNNDFSILYFPWPTDLLPYEIDNNINNLDNIKTTNNIYFIGSGTPEVNEIKHFCDNNNLKFIKIGGFDKNNISTELNNKYISESIIAPAIQTKWQVDNGYIPCRIFKNISYGKMGITNNITVYNLFENKIIYNSDIEKSLKLGLYFEKMNNKKEIIIPLMEYVRDYHTYINRINLILKYLNI